MSCLGHPKGLHLNMLMSIRLSLPRVLRYHLGGLRVNQVGLVRPGLPALQEALDPVWTNGYPRLWKGFRFMFESSMSPFDENIPVLTGMFYLIWQTRLHSRSWTYKLRLLSPWPLMSHLKGQAFLHTVPAPLTDPFRML
jgi:hypothetical protein